MCVLHRLHVRVLGKHQRQLLLEHQHAGGNRRDDVVAVVDQRLQLRDVEVLVLLDRLEIAQLELGHAAAFLLAQRRSPRCRCAGTPRSDPRAGAARCGRRSRSRTAQRCRACRRWPSPRRAAPASRARSPGAGLRMKFRNRRGRHRHPAQPRAIARPPLVPFTALTISATTGMPAMLPRPRVFESSLSRKECSPFLCCRCLARSIRCGKSMFQGCGGT